MEDMRRMIQETHDSTIKQEGMIGQCLRIIQEVSAKVENHESKIRKLEDEQLQVKTRLSTLAAVWTVVAGFFGLIGSAIGLLLAWRKS